MRLMHLSQSHAGCMHDAPCAWRLHVSMGRVRGTPLMQPRHAVQRASSGVLPAHKTSVSRAGAAMPCAHDVAHSRHARHSTTATLLAGACFIRALLPPPPFSLLVLPSPWCSPPISPLRVTTYRQCIVGGEHRAVRRQVLRVLDQRLQGSPRLAGGLVRRPGDAVWGSPTPLPPPSPSPVRQSSPRWWTRSSTWC